MARIVPFPGSEQASLSQVGGKAHSLIRMSAAGLPVPPGAVLPADLFIPWFDEITSSATWSGVRDGDRSQWTDLCGELKELALGCELTELQRKSLGDVRDLLASANGGELCAVRSSSPEEDLASASFAGGYETRLGVRPEDLEDAVRRCFASSLDERVLVYKQEQGFDPFAPSIAVIVQRQLDSEVSGVAFSLNPITNDYDEAVIDASWGLGETVVAGLVSPDHFVVDKVRRRVIERTLGAKQIAVRLGPGGGTVESEGESASELSLDDARLAEITETICRIEELFGKPVDVEWAYAEGRLQVLQARPITAYVPLPPEMTTRPGERRTLYADAALSKGLTINAPISPMGLDWMRESISSVIEAFLGPKDFDAAPEEAMWFFAGGRMYQNLSGVLWTASPKTLAKGTTATDILMSRTLAAVDSERYRAPTRPSWWGLGTIWLTAAVAWRLRGFFAATLRDMRQPEREHRIYQRRFEAFERRYAEHINYELPFNEFRRTYLADATQYLLGVPMPALSAGLIAVGLIDFVVGKKPARNKALAQKLKLGLPGNIVVEMSAGMSRLAKLLDRSDFEDLERLTERVKRREMPPEFLAAWDDFVAKYGFRGPLEMDLACPRYADAPEVVLRQVSFMGEEGGFDPEAAHQRLVEERRQAYEELLRRLGPTRRWLLGRLHRIVELFAGTRDTPKHHNLLFYSAVRKRALTEGRRLVEAGRLDRAEDVFSLTFEDVEKSVADPSLDLREIREERTRFLKILKAQVREFPGVIDSRGRILRPAPEEEKQGELRGMAVSPGRATGPVKLLRDPHEKTVEKGDVLVAYTTDPGWTPLFVAASAVVLEVGGTLQHGAVVAREYGKPCVVGIDRLTKKLRDGQMVEVDGTAGVVRLADQVELSPP